MNIIGLSGWLQSADTLQKIVPGMEVLRYDTLPDMRALVKLLGEKQPEAVIGWSLGGVLAVQALAEASYRPQKIVILGSPFQYRASDAVPEGIAQEVYQTLHASYQKDPQHLADRLQMMINVGLPSETPLCPLAENCADTSAWLPWLEHLAMASFHDFRLNLPTEQGEARSGGERSDGGLPPEILVIYGQKDAIISSEQGKYWSRIFPQVQIVVIPEASHAPHVQARDVVQRMIEEFLDA